MKKFILSKLRTKSFWVALCGIIAFITAEIAGADSSAVLPQVIKVLSGAAAAFGVILSPAKQTKSDCDVKSTSDSPDKNADSDKLK